MTLTCLLPSPASPGLPLPPQPAPAFPALTHPPSPLAESARGNLSRHAPPLVEHPKPAFLCAGGCRLRAPSPGQGRGALLQHRFHKTVKVGNVQVYINVIITGVDSLQGFGVAWLFGLVLLLFFFFGFVFVQKSLTFFCQTDIYLMKRRDT